jgi:hypothetical protein
MGEVLKFPTPEALTQEQVREKYESMTRDEAMEKIEDSIDAALDVQSQIQELLQSQKKEVNEIEADSNVVEIHDRAVWNEYKDLLDQRRSHLRFVPGDLCFENNLPYHPSEEFEKISYATAKLPDDPDYPTEGNNPKRGDGVRVDAQQQPSPGWQQAA